MILLYNNIYINYVKYKNVGNNFFLNYEGMEECYLIVRGNKYVKIILYRIIIF